MRLRDWIANWAFGPIALLGLASAWVSLSCTTGDPDDGVVATVGDRTVFAEDVRSVAARLVTGGLDPLVAKERALEAMVQRQLMVLEAERKGIWQSERRQRTWQKIDGDLLRNALDDELTADVRVTDEEVAEFMELGSIELFLREIVLPDSMTAVALASEIAAGRDFAEAARNGSIDPQGAYNEGLVPYPVNRLALYMSPYRSLLESKPGAIVGPLRIGQYYSLVRIEESRPATASGWTEDTVREKIEDFRREEILDDFLDEMKRKYHYAFNAVAAHRVARAVEEVMAEHRARAKRIKEEGGTPPTGANLLELTPRNGGDEWGLSDSLRAEWMYKHDAGGRTVGLYVDRMARMPVDLVAMNVSASQIELYCEEYFKDEVYPGEAKARGLDVKIDYERTRRNRYEKFLIEQLYQQEIAPKVEPDRETLKAYWQQHVSEFPTAPVISANMLCFDSEVEAKQAGRMLQQGIAFDDVVNELEEGDAEVTRDNRGRAGQGWFGHHLENLPIDAVKVARHPDGRTCVMQVTARRPGDSDFTESYDAVLEHYRLHNDEPYVTALLDEARSRYEINIDQDVLARLELSD